MKKCFYIVFAALAVFASCAKETLNESAQTSGDGGSIFSATIIQPNGLSDASKVSIIDQDQYNDRVFIQWNQGDNIDVIYKSHDYEQYWAADVCAERKTLSAESDGVTVNFVGQTDGWGQQELYAARYYGKDNAWKNYVLNPTDQNTVKIYDSYTAGEDRIPVLLENMPLYCKESTKNDGNINYFKFTSEHTILQINVPKKLEFDDLFVCLDDQDVTFENGSLKDSEYTLRIEGAANLKNMNVSAGKDYLTYFVPVSIGHLHFMRIIAAKGTLDTNMHEVARMESQNLEGQTFCTNAIYAFDFCNTLTIESEGNPFNLSSNNNIDYKVNIKNNWSGAKLIIQATDQTTAPANIYINAWGKTVDELEVNAPYSHVVISNGTSITVQTITSANTFVVKGNYKITGTGEGKGLTVEKGSVAIEGDNGKANVSQVTIPSTVTEQIKIDVSGVSAAQEDDRVKIVNNSEEATVVVVPDNVVNQKSYKVEKGEVSPVSKNAVARIDNFEYETLDAAIVAAAAGKTIELVSNIALDNPITIEKGITINGNGFTIAVSDAEYWKNYTATKFGQTNMITVKADNFTLKNVTLDGKAYRGVSLCTTKSGKNVLYENVTYTGRGCGHYYGEATGLVTFDGCKFKTQGYAVHFGGESAKDDDVVIMNCELNGWSSFGTCKSLEITDSHFGGANDEGKNGWLAVLRPYCPTTITNCTFSDIYLHEAVSGYECIGLGTGAATTVVLKGCKIVNDAKQEIVGADIYSIVRDNGFGDAAAQNGSVFAFDATGNTTDGFTAGTFYAKDPAKISVATGYEYYAIEGKTDIYGVRESEGNFVAKIGNTGYETLDAAFAAVQPNQTIEILKADTYTLPSPISSITIKGVEGVVFNAIKEYGQSVSLLHDVKFESVKFIFGSSNYTGFQHSESVIFTKCTFEGKFHSYGTMLFDQCVFNSPEGDYSMWCYAGDVTYKNCTINCKGKFVNVYNEGNTTADRPWKVVAEGCTFNSTKANKAAFNIKATCGSKPLYYDVEIKDCRANGDNWPKASTSESLVVGSALWQVDDIKSSVASKIKVTVDNNVVYQSPVTE